MGIYAGMTVNERLLEAKLFADFSSAVKARNKEKIIEILTKVDIPKNEAVWICDTILVNPTKYGY